MSPWAKSLSKRKFAAFRRGRLVQIFIPYEVLHPSKSKQTRANLWKLLDFLQGEGVIEADQYEYAIDAVHEMERKGRSETCMVIEVSGAKMQRALVDEELKNKFLEARKNPRAAAGLVFYPAGELINVLETPLD